MSVSSSLPKSHCANKTHDTASGHLSGIIRNLIKAYLSSSSMQMSSRLNSKSTTLLYSSKFFD